MTLQGRGQCGRKKIEEETMQNNREKNQREDRHIGREVVSHV